MQLCLFELIKPKVMSIAGYERDKLMVWKYYRSIYDTLDNRQRFELWKQYFKDILL